MGARLLPLLTPYREAWSLKVPPSEQPRGPASWPSGGVRTQPAAWGRLAMTQRSGQFAEKSGRSDKGLNRCRNDATPAKDRGHGGKAGGWVLDMLLEQGGCFALVDDCSGVIDQPETADGI